MNGEDFSVVFGEAKDCDVLLNVGNEKFRRWMIESLTRCSRIMADIDKCEDCESENELLYKLVDELGYEVKVLTGVLKSLSS